MVRMRIVLTTKVDSSVLLEKLQSRKWWDTGCGLYAFLIVFLRFFFCSPLMPRKRITCAEGFKPYFDKCIGKRKIGNEK